MHRILALLVIALPSLAHADCPAKPELRSYYKPDKLPDKVTTRCDVKDGKCVAVDLKGWLYVPRGPIATPATVKATKPSVQLATSDRPPLLVFNHGSEEMATGSGDKCDIATYFLERGFVVFVPHRRGHGKSTGAYLDEYTKKFCTTPNQSGPCKMEYLHEHVDDIEEAIKYVKGLKDDKGKALVDANRIVIAGHSFGGIATVFANTKDIGQRVAIDGAGASQSWEGNESARDEMKEAVKKQIRPVYFIEPMNDHSIDATIELAKVAGQSCRQYQSALFPAVDTDKDGKSTQADYVLDQRDRAHGTFMGAKIDQWGPSAIEFANRYFALPVQTFDTLCQGTSSQP
jgi:pimeloyl-ACP methyl ester carboxylesterase